MTSTEPLTEREMAAVDGLRALRDISPRIAIAMLGCVVGELIEQLPADERMTVAQAFCDCLLDVTRGSLDA